MKIGIDASRFSHEQATGVEWYSWHIINGLLGMERKNEIVLYSREPLKLDGGFANVQNKVISAKRLWTLKGLTKEMKQNPPDVLFVPSHTLPLSLPSKSVITIHDVAFKHLRKAYSFAQYHYLNWSTKFAVKNAGKIIVPSAATKKDLIHFYKCNEDKIVVIPHGFSEPKDVGDEVFANSEMFKHFEIEPGLKYILFVGRLESKKNLVRLVEAFKIFNEKNPDYILIMAGKRGVGFNKIWKRVEELKLADKVIMPGYITEDEKAALYRHARVFAFPSLYEGFGLPILEAFYYQKPVLCANVSSLPEVGGDGVHYVDPYNIGEMAAGLEKLVMDRNYAESLVKKGEQILGNFSWEKATKKTWEVLLS